MNCERKSACRNDCRIQEYKQDFSIQILFPQPEKKKTLSGRLALHKEWKFMAADLRRLKFKTEAILLPGNSRRFVGTYSFRCGKENGGFKKFLQLVRSFVYEFYRFSISTRTEQASQTKVNWIKLNRFQFYLWRKYFEWFAPIMLNITVGFPLLPISQLFMQSFCNEQIFVFQM